MSKQKNKDRVSKLVISGKQFKEASAALTKKCEKCKGCKEHQDCVRKRKPFTDYGEEVSLSARAIKPLVPLLENFKIVVFLYSQKNNGKIVKDKRYFLLDHQWKKSEIGNTADEVKNLIRTKYRYQSINLQDLLSQVHKKNQLKEELKQFSLYMNQSTVEALTEYDPSVYREEFSKMTILSSSPINRSRLAEELKKMLEMIPSIGGLFENSQELDLDRVAIPEIGDEQFEELYCKFLSHSLFSDYASLEIFTTHYKTKTTQHILVKKSDEGGADLEKQLINLNHLIVLSSSGTDKGKIEATKLMEKLKLEQDGSKIVQLKLYSVELSLHRYFLKKGKIEENQEDFLNIIQRIKEIMFDVQFGREFFSELKNPGEVDMNDFIHLIQRHQMTNLHSLADIYLYKMWKEKNPEKKPKMQDILNQLTSLVDLCDSLQYPRLFAWNLEIFALTCFRVGFMSPHKAKVTWVGYGCKILDMIKDKQDLYNLRRGPVDKLTDLAKNIIAEVFDPFAQFYHREEKRPSHVEEEADLQEKDHKNISSFEYYKGDFMDPGAYFDVSAMCEWIFLSAGSVQSQPKMKNREEPSKKVKTV